MAVEEGAFSLGRSVGVSDAEIAALLTQKDFFGSWRVSLDNGAFFVSPSISRLFGFGKDVAHFAVSDPFQPVHPEDRERVEFEISQAVIKSGDFTVQYRMADGRGRYQAAYTHGRVVTAADGSRSLIGLTCLLPQDGRTVGYVDGDRGPSGQGASA